MIKLKNKKVILTGCKGQLGKKITEVFEKEGALVYGFDIDQFDLRDKEKVLSHYKALFNRVGNIDILINNAGVSVFEDSMLRTEDDFDFVSDVNLKGTFNSIQSFVKCIDKHKQDKASIINIASLYGVISPDFRIYGDGDRKNSEVYGATKAGIIQMTKYFAVYLAEKNIRVNCVSPGGIFNQNNPQSDEYIKKYNDRCPMKRMANDNEIVGGIAYLSSDISSYVNGHNLIIDGGFVCW